MKKRLLILLILICLLMSLEYLYSSRKSFIQLKDTKINLLIARTPDEQKKGLGGRISLDENTAMLFDFGQLGPYIIWMKDMNFPLDIFWLDENYKIVHLEREVSPLDFPKKYSSVELSRYVLEANAGFALKNNLKEGDFLDIVKK